MRGVKAGEQRRVCHEDKSLPVHHGTLIPASLDIFFLLLCIEGENSKRLNVKLGLGRYLLTD